MSFDPRPRFNFDPAPRMNLDPVPRSLDGVREMKVKIPLRLHVSLHSLKLLSGRQISEIVTEALITYMATQAQRPLMDTGLEVPSGPAVPP